MSWAYRVLLGSLPFVGGCAGGVRGDWSTMIWPGGPALIEKTPESGTYKLYAANTTTPLRHAWLKEGDQIGFLRDAKGRLRAVAGRGSWKIVEGSYYWVLPSEQDAEDSHDRPSLSQMLSDFASDAADSFADSLPDAIADWIEDAGNDSDSGRHSSHHSDGNHDHQPPHNHPTTQPHSQ